MARCTIGELNLRIFPRHVIRKILATASGLLLFALSANPQNENLPPPVHLTAEQDHQRTMKLLNITELRRGPDGDPNSPRHANFDESKVPSKLNLPNPLVLNNGNAVTTPDMWWKQRRPELVELFDREIYGRVPLATPKVNWEVVSSVEELSGSVPVTTKKLVGHVDNSSYPLIKVDIDLTLTTPAKAKGPVPVMMEFGLSPEVLAAIKKRLDVAARRRTLRMSERSSDCQAVLI